MLNVSGVSFGSNPIIEREGKYTQRPQAEQKAPNLPADSFDKPKKKHTGLKAFWTTVGLLIAATAGLGWASKAGKLPKIDAPSGMLDHAKNFFGDVGARVVKGYDAAVEFIRNIGKPTA